MEFGFGKDYCTLAMTIAGSGSVVRSRPWVATKDRDQGPRPGSHSGGTHTRDARRGPRGSRGHPPPPWAGDPHWTRGGPRHNTYGRAVVSCQPAPNHRSPGVRASRAPDPWASAGPRVDAVTLIAYCETCQAATHSDTQRPRTTNAHTTVDHGVVMCSLFE